MTSKRLALASVFVALIAVGSVAVAYTIQFSTRTEYNFPAPKKQVRLDDLSQMTRSKWIVTSVERDGKTVPAQYGQRKGDLISFELDETGALVFG